MAEETEHVLDFESWNKAKEMGDEDALRGFSLSDDSTEELTDIETPTEDGEEGLEISDEQPQATEEETGSDEFDAEWGDTPEETSTEEGGEAPEETPAEQSGESIEGEEEAGLEEFDFEDLDNA